MNALADIVEGAASSFLWGRLGWRDIRQRYRRSRLGPFWLTISMGAMIGALSVLYAALFRLPVADYLPFMAAGIVVWGLISSLIGDGCRTFIEAESIIKRAQLPLSIHVYRTVWRNFLIFAHNSVILVIVAVLFSIRPGWVALLAVPGVVLICMNGVWIGLLFGLTSARFRDVPEVVASVMQIAFFLTPVFWHPDRLPRRAIVVDVNPFFYFLEVVRAPLLGQVPTPTVWGVALSITLCGWLTTYILYARRRGRIAYWI